MAVNSVELKGREERELSTVYKICRVIKLKKKKDKAVRRVLMEYVYCAAYYVRVA